MTSLYYQQQKIINPLLIERFNIKSFKELPKLDNLIISSSSKTAHSNETHLFNLLILLELITGQNSIITRAKQSISNFKLRERSPLGGKINLSKKSVWNFLTYLNLIILPQLYKSLDNKRGFTLNSKFALDLGIKDFNSFPEIQNKAEKLKTNIGLTVTIKVKSNDLLKTRFLINSLQILIKN